MNTTNIKQALADTAIAISNALTQVEENPKQALANIGIAYSKLKEAGDAIEQDISAKEEVKTETTKNPVEEAFAFIKGNFPAFDGEALIKAYTSEGVKGGLRYLLKVSNTDLVAPINYSEDGGVNVLSFTVVNGIIADNGDRVVKALTDLLSLAGRKVVFSNTEAVENGRKFTFVLGKENGSVRTSGFVRVGECVPLSSIIRAIFG